MVDLNKLSLGELYAELARDGLVRRLVELARDEDLGARGDVTSGVCIDAGRVGRAVVVAREAGVLAGLAVASTVVSVLAPGTRLSVLVSDGLTVSPGQEVARLDGPLREILAAERTLLNVVGRLSGVATRTREYVQAAGALGGRAGVYDTRKTTPGMRVLEKYAVRCGGGRCHRIGLYDAVLIKDNHLAGVPPDRLAGFVGAAVERAKAVPGGVRFVECEVDSLDQLAALLAGGGCRVDVVLLDNMGPKELRRAVGMRGESAVAVELEASGGVTLETIGEISATGVERISVGGLTHHAVSLDLALDAEG
ncbi:MAG: carboxylating nicotinate-nucleotide diphosphorylase [Phycisphaeraceae bacterium]|nr:carboxylating nicotinate-nucleotide diphosphorylase [Phycisphaeraceae bacterium]